MLNQLLLAILVITPTTVLAQNLPSAPYLPLTVALKAARTALETCEVSGYKVSVAVISREGSIIALLKADNSGPHTVASAQGKAFTAASFNVSTADLAETIAKVPTNSGLRDLDERIVIQAGGLPIKFNSTIVAGIGVGGAPSAEADVKCAKAGLKAIAADDN